MYEDFPAELASFNVTCSTDLIPHVVSKSLDRVKKFGQVFSSNKKYDRISDPNLIDYLTHMMTAVRLTFICGLVAVVKKALNLNQLGLSISDNYEPLGRPLKLSILDFGNNNKSIELLDNIVAERATITQPMFESLYYSGDIGPLLSAELEDTLGMNCCIQWRKGNERQTDVLPAKPLCHCLKDIYKAFCNEINDKTAYPNGFLNELGQI